ncbi:MAG: hypothetical protein HOI88_08205 [Phycisphaerae bacterium]|jgi:hypothetical protein|nr:hypothetical protein [Phycisphaerae bacterium]MBT6270312.1 hypothetical protein [Phycisphaerae bacterium]MBT6282246.1 hypothetical protein [Phycisphaerae bacterium]
MSTSTSISENEHQTTILVAHRAGRLWRCLIAATNASNPAAQPEILETLEVDSDNALEQVLKAKAPTTVYAILPGASTICRTTTLPDIDEEQIFEVLRLQAEAKLLGHTSPSRRAIAPLEAAVGETNRVGLIVAWPENSKSEFPSCLEDAFYIPDAVSLAALINGFRSTEPSVLADPTDGTVTLSISHPNGAAFRATREDFSNKESFVRGIVRIAQETASMHNHTDVYTNEMASKLQHEIDAKYNDSLVLLLPDTIMSGASKQITGAPAEDTVWWNNWGITAGALLAITGPLKTLTTIRQKSPELHPSFLEQVTARLETKSFAGRLLITAALLLAIGPALFSGVRLTILEMMNPEISSQYTELIESRKQQIVYKELGKISWPMTKVIADLTNNIPIGIEIESIRIDIGQPISVRGRARNEDGNSAAELIALMQTNLQGTGIFKEITFAYDPAGTYGSREFDLWATVTDPLRRPRYTKEQDFGKWTFAMRQAGIEPEDEIADVTKPRAVESNSSPMNEANNDSIPNNTAPIETLENSDTRIDNRPRPMNSDSGGALSHSGNRGGENSPIMRVPDPITAEEIALMNRNETMIAVKDIAEAKKRVGRSNPEVKERLQKEFRLLMDHLKELPIG